MMMMKSSIPIVTTIFVLIVMVMGTNIQAFSQNTNATSDQTFNQNQASGLQSISEKFKCNLW